MFQDDPLFSIITFAIAAYLFYMWWGDFSFYKKNGAPRDKAFQGATSAPLRICLIGAMLAAVLLAIHVLTEDALGVSQEQSSVGIFALFSWVGAAFVEELIFRGYLVVQKRGMAVLILSAVFFSFVFAAGHPFLWDYQVPEGAHFWQGVWSTNFTLQPAMATLAIFECSLLFYFLRFAPTNPNRSLLPCIIAHLTYNVGVFAAKAFQGFVSWSF